MLANRGLMRGLIVVRSAHDITIDLVSVMPKHGISFSASGAARLHPAGNRVELGDGSSLEYDYLVVATGPELAFDEIDGFGPEWASSGRWVHAAKVAFEKYFLHKVRAGTTEPYYERAVMKFLDIGKIKRPAA